MAFEASHLLRSVNMVHFGVLKGGAAWQHTSQMFQEDSQFGLSRCQKSVNPAVAQLCISRYEHDIDQVHSHKQ